MPRAKRRRRPFLDTALALCYDVTMTPMDPKRAVLYVRVSTEEQSLGPEAQREAAVRWAGVRGVAIVAVHEDRGVSGAAALDRCPALLVALDDIPRRRAGVLLVAKRDRLARDVVKAAMVERLAARYGAVVVSAAGEGEGTDPSSQLMRTMIDAFAAYERALIRARTKAALAVKKGRGERVGQVPYGYCLAADGCHIDPVPAEHAVIAHARKLRAAGLSFAAVGAEIGRTGSSPRAGGRWHPQQIARMVT